MKYTGLNLPAHCTMIEENELPEIYGGGSILSFIQYLLSGFTINFGWGADNDSYDTTVTTGRPGWGWGGNTSHSTTATTPPSPPAGPAGAGAATPATLVSTPATPAVTAAGTPASTWAASLAPCSVCSADFSGPLRRERGGLFVWPLH